MSRKISNPKLAKLLRASHIALHDLAAIVGVSPRALLSYSHGRPLPILERKLARHMKISIPELRDLLGINQPALLRQSTTQGVFARQKRRKSYATTAAESLPSAAQGNLFDDVCDTLSKYNEIKTIYRWANGRGRWVNGGARFAGWESLQSFIGKAQSVPRSIIVLKCRREFQVRRIVNIRRRQNISSNKQGARLCLLNQQ